MGTKAIFAICIKIFGCGTPEESIIASCICAAIVFLAIKPEGKFAVFTICISVLHSHHYKENKCSGEISHQLIKKNRVLDIIFSWRILVEKRSLNFQFEIQSPSGLSIGKVIIADIVSGNFERITWILLMAKY